MYINIYTSILHAECSEEQEFEMLDVVKVGGFRYLRTNILTERKGKILIQKQMESSQDIDEFLSLWRQAEKSSETLKVIQALFYCLQVRDPLTAEHSANMARYATQLASHFDRENVLLYFAGSLTHDIGKLGISDRILKGDSKLSNDERKSISVHVTAGVYILQAMGLPQLIVDIAEYHHERYDGSGYSKGLVGNEIPLAGRIAAIADTFSALTSTRPYAPALSRDKAIEIMARDKKLYDPKILSYFFAMKKKK
ncbi:HD-GYP domain-containing protein [Paenibacillus sp. MMO-177]|uniref:HD-GYP domain-containing protein n=1 Tax=Paenibacillus sp. MMO-177 TaxID=3081289 RepID=UPI003017D4FF